MLNSSKPIIGIIERVSIGRRAIDVPAKIDTGADSSSIWATNIRIDKTGVLKFSLFGEGSPYYNGKIYKRTDYTASVVRSSNGETQIRYRTAFTVSIAGRKVKAQFNLSDRSRNNYKILIGRRTISKKFLIDVAKGADELPPKNETLRVRVELEKGPYEFHKKYVESQKGQKL